MINLWQRYGKAGIVGLLIFVLGVIAIQYWHHHVQVQAETASDQYQMLMLATDKKDLVTVKKLSTDLVAMYNKTPYADLALLMLAKTAVEEKQLEVAKEHLQKIIQRNKNNCIYHVAKIRLARILQELQDYSAALAILADSDNIYGGLYEEIKGDIYLQQGNIKAARAAYLQARAKFPEGIEVPWLSYKLSDLDGAGLGGTND